MLRLRVAAALPWVDSTNGVRSPFEQFTILNDEARQKLTAEPRPPIAWEFGVLTDSWERPQSSKPLLVGGEDGGVSSVTCYALGSDAADEYHEQLQPLWLAFLNWLNERRAIDVYFFADEFWIEGRGWLEFGEAVQRCTISGVAPARSITPGVYTARPQQLSLGTLLQTWWPSGLGMLGGVSLRKAMTQSQQEVLTSQGRLTAVDVTGLDSCFQTAASFDNLGFLVLSRVDNWAEVRAALARKGWTDGLPVELALARL